MTDPPDPPAEPELRRTTTGVWREEVLAETGRLQLMLTMLSPPIEPAQAQEIRDALDSAFWAATGRRRSLWRRLYLAFTGAHVERAWGSIDSAQEALFRLGTDTYRVGQMPRITRRVQDCLPKDDYRRVEFEQVRPTSPMAPIDRERVVAAFHAANSETRKTHSRIRNFRNLILGCAVVLTIAAVVLGVVGHQRPTLALLCFQPSGQAVCPTRVVATDPALPVTGQPPAALEPWQIGLYDHRTRMTASKWDVLLVELLGVIAAALAAATALRRLQGSSSPYSVPFAVALLKLPSGALTATLGLMLIRADFIPGLSALDSPPQILGWAIVLGYAQQLFTRFVDARAQSVLSAGAGGTPAKPVP